eukprot:TRINITY_DN43513_c0_g1_i1.p1 TRINITY_DN43513_c0_g1~~TRINITY_DN43513_c0_g1_i1.p1  ORF type:complete len:471 (+),score=45.41 TRINITY_DN43513_c0_g1_i1:111-1523(+)
MVSPHATLKTEVWPATIDELAATPPGQIEEENQPRFARHGLRPILKTRTITADTSVSSEIDLSSTGDIALQRDGSTAKLERRGHVREMALYKQSIHDAMQTPITLTDRMTPVFNKALSVSGFCSSGENIQGSFSCAARQAFCKLEPITDWYQQRPLRLNAVGGCSEIGKPDGAYRKHLKKRGRLVYFNLFTSMTFSTMNCYVLVFPNLRVILDRFGDYYSPPHKHSGIRESWLTWLEVAMAIFEVCGFIVICSFTGYHLCRASGSDCYDTWASMCSVSWHWIPLMARFSAIKSLGNIHPKILQGELNELVGTQNDQDPTKSSCIPSCHGVVCSFLMFALRTFFILSCGLAAFVVKIHHITALLADPSNNWEQTAYQIFSVCMFANQCVNMIDVGYYLKKEAIEMAFAGQDAVCQRSEFVFMAVFRACVAKQVWTAFRQSRGWLYATAVLFAFNNLDVQRCAISEVEDDDF